MSENAAARPPAETTRDLPPICELVASMHKEYSEHLATLKHGSFRHSSCMGAIAAMEDLSERLASGRALAAGRSPVPRGATLKPFAYLCPANCGCTWRDNEDGSMSLYGANSKSCVVCEFLPLKRLLPLYAPTQELFIEAGRSTVESPPSDELWNAAMGVVSLIAQEGIIPQMSDSHYAALDRLRNALKVSRPADPAPPQGRE